MLNHEQIEALQSFQPKLIFFDIDGTLLNTEGNYSAHLEQQLQRLHSQGVKLAVASGRPAIAAQFLFDRLPLTSAGLFCTGTELYEPKNKKHLQLHLLNSSDLSQLYGVVKNQALYCEFYTPDFYTFDPSIATSQPDHNDINQIHSQHLRIPSTPMTAEQVLQQELPITKLLLGVNQKKQGDSLHALVEAFPQLEFAFAHFLARPDWLFASVIPKTADKNTGFDTLLKYHQISAEEVAAFGDSHSDTVFLQRAGLGIAMGNASEVVKKTANISTLTADNDGVAVALQYFN
ncbi:MAG: HAD-IIB family hydrolase [Cellvibrionaceae bacterium]